MLAICIHADATHLHQHSKNLCCSSSHFKNIVSHVGKTDWYTISLVRSVLPRHYASHLYSYTQISSHPKSNIRIPSELFTLLPGSLSVIYVLQHLDPFGLKHISIINLTPFKKVRFLHFSPKLD